MSCRGSQNSLISGRTPKRLMVTLSCIGNEKKFLPPPTFLFLFLFPPKIIPTSGSRDTDDVDFFNEKNGVFFHKMLVFSGKPKKLTAGGTA